MFLWLQFDQFEWQLLMVKVNPWGPALAVVFGNVAFFQFGMTFKNRAIANEFTKIQRLFTVLALACNLQIQGKDILRLQGAPTGLILRLFPSTRRLQPC